MIATPVNTHYKFARKALEAGKHIWVEKPFTSTSEEAEDLIELAEKRILKSLSITLLFTMVPLEK
ncbi:MAG: Gfo/Idh/MocA family oxidoreductase [Ignavibacteriaceae bacterium]|nr:Gfo/Idh/MocA family oxidoreductase [Ignavibacteriaceae bacterium]